MKNFLPVLLLMLAVSRLGAVDLTVSNTNSSGPGSLFQAITDANNTPGADRVLFDIPGGGVHTIDVSQNPLPTIFESLVIDGYSQPGAKANSLTVGDNAVVLIHIDGGSDFFKPSNGLLFDKHLAVSGRDYLSSNHVVRGLCLTGFADDPSGSRPGGRGGLAVGALRGNNGSVDSLVVSGNFIGVLPDGETARRNIYGIGSMTLAGGTDPASRNVISGNSYGFIGDGVLEGNYIGTNASGNKAVGNGRGVALGGELYNTSRPFSGIGETANISTRGVVGTGDNVMIAGVILEETPGMTRIVARALGPSLAAAGVSDPLPDPLLEVHDSQGGLVASNDNWRDGQAAALTAIGFAPANDKESAIFIRLPSGSYTAIVRGKGESTGVGLVELYNLH